MQIQFVSQSLGILSTFFGWLTSFIGAVLAIIIKVAIALVSNMLYMIGVQLFGLLDFVQMVFKRLAGLDTHWYNGVGREEDILLSLFQDPAVLNSLIAMTIVAVAMLIIATIVQIIRVEYTTEGAKNTKGGIIGASFKALAMFMIVPIGSFMGIFISNQLLRSIEAATNVGGSQYIGGAIFVASTNSANKVRYVQSDFASGEYGDTFDNIMDVLSGIVSAVVMSSVPGMNLGTAVVGGAGGGLGIDGTIAGWNLVNEDGSIKAELNNGGMFTSTKSDPVEKRNEIAEKIDRAFANKLEYNNSTLGDFGYFDYNNVALVSVYYNISSMNFLLLIAGSVMAIYFLYMAAFGMIMRLFKATALFIIAPPVVALMPLDNGNAFKQWRTNFIGSIISAYGVIVALNIFFLVMPVLENIKIFDPSNWLNYGNNALVYLLFVIVGLMSVSKISKVVSDVAGKGDDALAEGSAVGKKITGAAINTVAMAYGVGHAMKMGKSLMASSEANFAAAENEIDPEKKEKLIKRATSEQDKAMEYKARSKRIGKEIPEVMFKKGAQAFGGDIDKTLDNIEGPFRKKDKFEYEVDQSKRQIKKKHEDAGLIRDADKVAKDFKREKEAREVLDSQMQNFDTSSEAKFKSGIDKSNRSYASSMAQIRNKDGLLDRYMTAQEAYKNNPDSVMAKEAFEEASARMAEAMDGLGEKLERVADVTQKAALDKLKAGQELSKGEAASIKKLTGDEARSARAAVAYNKTAEGSAAASTAFTVVAKLKADPSANVASGDVNATLEYLSKTKQLTDELNKLLSNARKSSKVKVVDNDY